MRALVFLVGLSGCAEDGSHGFSMTDCIHQETARYHEPDSQRAKDGKIDSSQKEELTVLRLREALKKEADLRKMYSRYNSAMKFEGLLLVVGGDHANHETLTEILYTAGQAEFSRYFFVSQKEDDTHHRALGYTEAVPKTKGTIEAESSSDLSELHSARIP